jgi:2',3'-cyclic-nucleotide 3'-phosphodiesterase
LSWNGQLTSNYSGDQPVPEDILNEVAKVVCKAGVKLPGYDDDSADQKDNQEHWHGWEGGVIWLVPTYKPISEWSTPIATLDLGSLVKEEREP